MDLTYKANKTFAQVHSDPNKYIYVRGPVGSGKSSGCIWHLFLNAMAQQPDSEGVRRTRYGVIRATYPALKSTVIKSFQDWFKGLLTVVYDTPIRGAIKLPHPDGETQIEMELYFIALDSEEQINKLQSLELTGAWCNEAAEMQPGIIKMLKTRIDRFPAPKDGGPTKPFILCDYNSVHTEHWLYQLAEEDETPKHSFYAQPSALLMCEDHEATSFDTDGNGYKLNPEADNIENLSSDYYVDMILGSDPDFINVYVLNNYGHVRSGRPVYREYDDSTHCTKHEIEPQKGVPMVIGMDLGLMPACAFTQLTPEGKFLVVDEIVTEDCSIQAFCEDYLWPKIRNDYAGFNFYLVIDPAAVARSQNDAKAAWEIIKEAGLPYRTAKSNNPTARREAVVHFLRQQDKFHLSPKCKVLRKGFISEYKFEKLRASQTEMFKEKPEKNLWSHIHDGLQYAALEASGGRVYRRKAKPVEDIYSTPASAVAGY